MRKREEEMAADPGHLASVYGLCVLLLLITGLYCIMVSRNLIRILIGVELLSKAVTLLFVAAGYISGRTAQAQALVIVFIIVEVVVIAVASGIVIGAFRLTGDVNTRKLQNLKG
jgi:NADH:ubiquinone oxidoreductase subunit K